MSNPVMAPLDPDRERLQPGQGSESRITDVRIDVLASPVAGRWVEGTMDEHQTWSYGELTAAVEAEITRQLKKAHDASSEVTRRACQDYAVGAYIAWESIMRTHLTERRLRDAQRLGTLVSPPAALIQPGTQISSPPDGG